MLGGRSDLFFPACMVIVGAHYLPFVFLYGMRLFAVLAALMTLVGVLLLGMAVWLAVKRRILVTAIAGVLGAATLLWYFTTDEVPGDFTTMTPYVTTLLVLALASQRLRMPAADGLPYRRGQGG